MKSFYLLVCLLLSSALQAANWELFPLNQKMYYHDQSTGNLDWVLMDYLVSSVQITSKYEIPSAGNCRPIDVDTNIPFGWPYNCTKNFFHFNSVDSSNGESTVSGYWGTFPFPIGFNVGESMNVGQITITCSAVGIETFFGLTDSVKIYSIQNSSISQGQVPISNFQYKISKNYGMLEMIPFDMVLQNGPNVDFFSYQLIGVNRIGLAAGYQFPLTKDFFPLEECDLIQSGFMVSFGGIPEVLDSSYLETFDTIVNVTYNYPSLTNTYYNSNKLYSSGPDQITYSHSLDHYNELFNIPPNWIGFAIGWMGNVNNHNSVYTSGDYKIHFDLNTGDTITTVDFRNHIIFESGGCDQVFAADHEANIRYNTLVGKSISCSYAWGNCDFVADFIPNGCQTILPIQLESFEGKALPNGNLLEWRTLSETTNSHFELQRSVDSREWETLGAIETKGNEFAGANYSFLDNQGQRQDNYYRLKQIDLDGSHTNSKIIFIKSGFLANETFSIYPNPASDQLFFNQQLGKLEGTLTIRNMDGAIIQQHAISSKITSISINELAPGSYFITWNTDTSKETSRFVKL